jgi:hypothetical protein
LLCLAEGHTEQYGCREPCCEELGAAERQYGHAVVLRRVG